MGTTDPPTSDPADVVVEFMHAANDHDVPRALAMLHPGFLFREEGNETPLDLAGMADLLGWDAKVASQAHCETMKSEGATVSGRFWETNEIYRRLGIETTRCRLTFQVEDGLIREQVIEQLDEEMLSAALEPFLGWAEASAREEVATIQPEGEFVFSPEMADRWLRLLDRWESETGGAGVDEADPD